MCLRESIDTSTAMGRAFVQIAAVFAELERGLVSERTKAGMAQKKLEGSVFGKPSKLDPAVRCPYHPPSTPAGVSCTQIARELAAEGVPTGPRRPMARPAPSGISCWPPTPRPPEPGGFRRASFVTFRYFVSVTSWSTR